MPNRQEHQAEVSCFLQEHFPNQSWSFSLPRGTGTETYLVQGTGQNYFVKVGAPVERYLAMAEIDLTPPLLACGQLPSGASILVQPFVAGRNPSCRDYWDRLEEAATLVRKMHNSPGVQATLPRASSNLHKDAGRQALDRLSQKWKHYRAQVPRAAGFVDRSLEALARQVDLFSSDGLVASHGDICNANWLFASTGKLYIVDLESMSMDDPAADLGALLWWYYPPELRKRFLEIAGYRYDDNFQFRMQTRMAIHCLHITLPRADSFDIFDASEYEEWLTDFRAILAGKENPQGYNE